MFVTNSSVSKKQRKFQLHSIDASLHKQIKLDMSYKGEINEDDYIEKQRQVYIK